MVRARTHHNDDIQAALKKLKNESNAKEVELIELIASIYENLKESKDSAVDKVQDTANSVNTSVHLHPWAYIGGASLCAFFLGLFIRR